MRKDQKAAGITNIHLVEFHGIIIETTVTDKATVAENWMQQIGRLFRRNGEKRIVGMDCKFIRHPINSLSSKIALLQLCVHGKCLVVQLLHMDHIPQSVKDFLCDSDTTFVGVEIEENSGKLLKEYGLKVRRKLDVHFLAKTWFPMSYKARPALKALAHGIAGISMRKSCKSYKGDWESRVLDQELVERACVDAYVSYAIAHKLSSDDD